MQDHTNPQPDMHTLDPDEAARNARAAEYLARKSGDVWLDRLIAFLVVSLLLAGLGLILFAGIC